MSDNRNISDQVGTSQQRLYLSVGVIVVLSILAGILFIWRRANPSSLDLLMLYVLIGFIGGLLFYTVDPLKVQSFKWKEVLNLGGAAGVGAAFMFLASILIPQDFRPSLDTFKEIAKELQDRINNKFKDSSIEVTVSTADFIVDVSNFSPSEEENIRKQLVELSGSEFESKIVFDPPKFEVILMDSFLPELIYDPKKGSNAAILNNLLKDLQNLDISTESTNPGWDLHQQVLEGNPDLVLIHASSFLHHTWQPEESELVDLDPFVAFLKYMAPTKSKFIVYSRVLGSISEEQRAKHLESVDARLKNRIRFFHAKEHFKTQAELIRLKQTVKDFLGLI